MRDSIIFSVILVFLFSVGIVSASEPLSAGVLHTGLPDEATSLRNALSSITEDAGYTVEPVDLAGLCDPALLSTSRLGLLVLPDASALPGDAVQTIDGFLRSGGDILALNAPLWQRQLIQDGDTWLDQDAFAANHADDLMQRVLFDFSRDDISGWRRTTNDAAAPAMYEVAVSDGTAFSRALHASVSKLSGWDTFVSPPLGQPFAASHSLTVFYAKGGPDTAELAIEWTERDGSRWIATTPLSESWRQYVLAPADFRYWESVATRAHTEFDPANASILSVGLAHTHTRLSGDKHEYWIGTIGTAERTPTHDSLLTHAVLPAWELLSPGYKFFSPESVAYLYARKDQNFVAKGLYPVPAHVRSTYPRPRAGGLDKGRAWRWQPLIEAATDGGQWRGAPAAMLLHVSGPYQGGIWASYAIADLAWYETPEALSSLSGVLKAIRRGVFLVDAGANHYTYFDGQKVTVGMRVANLGKAASEGLTGRVRLLDRTSGQEVHNSEFSVSLAENTEQRYTAEWVPETWPGQGVSVQVELLEGDELVDIARHDAYVWRPKAELEPITVRDGEFVHKGRRWRAHGVNYMPSSGVGTEDQSYFEYWLGARSYDPEVIDRDLRHIADLGMNAVSVFLYRESMEAQNLLDLLRRCDSFGIKVNLSLRPGTPLDFEWDMVREMLEYYRICEHDCVFALDLAWEPMFGNHDERTRWDGRWREWVAERYGSIENAEKDWGFAGPRDVSGQLANPLTHHAVEDGPWRAMVAAYRRFLDTLLYEYYSKARDLVRSIDPIHVISFRMTEAGNPTFFWGERIPYDFPYLAAAVDMLAPEAYGRIGDWEKVKPGWFQHEYARWAAPGLPMIWAEAGVSAWSLGKMASTPELLQFQADYYTHLYRMFIGSAVDGVFFWWYPGGYRTNERSDYGIVNPDGSDRPVSKVIREHAHQFLYGPAVRPVTDWLVFDRDAHAAGIAGAYKELADSFWDLIEQGKTPGLKTEATATTSADCPLVAVGNTPCNGTNPPKYLDGFFDHVEILDAEGQWTPAARGQTVRVGKSGPVKARLKVMNLGEAQWLAKEQNTGEGTVAVIVEGVESHTIHLPSAVSRHKAIELDEVVLLETPPSEPATVTLTFECLGRTRFGPRFAFQVEPAG